MKLIKAVTLHYAFGTLQGRATIKRDPSPFELALEMLQKQIRQVFFSFFPSISSTPFGCLESEVPIIPGLSLSAAILSRTLVISAVQ